MLLEIAIGDAFGAGYEFQTPKLEKLGGYVRHPHHHELRPGQYTDDTQMSLAIAELILSKRKLSRHAFAEAFVEAFHRDPRVGYAGRFYDFLRSHTSAETFLADIKPTSDKCGAAMRSVPLGILDEAEIHAVAPLQAAITHDCAPAIDSSVIVALVAHHLRVKHTREGLDSTLASYLNRYPTLTSWQGYVDGKAIPTVAAALTALLTHHTQTDLLLWCVNLGGDVDSVAAIAMGLASFVPNEITPNLPPHLVYGLENGAWGREKLASLDRQISESFGIATSYA